MDGVLKAFELRLQMLYARLKDLDRALRTSVRRRHYRLCAWRLAAIALGCHCSSPPRSLWGSRERKRERDPTGESAGPASLDQWPRTPRLCAIALRRQSSSRLKSHTPSQPTQDTPLQTPHRTTAAERFHLHGVRGWRFAWAASFWVQRALQELVAVAVRTVVVEPEARQLLVRPPKVASEHPVSDPPASTFKQTFGQCNR